MPEREFFVGENIVIIEGKIDKERPDEIPRTKFIGKFERYVDPTMKHSNDIIVVDDKGRRHNYAPEKGELSEIYEYDPGNVHLDRVEGVYSLERLDIAELRGKFIGLLESLLEEVRVGADALPELKRAGTLATLRNLNNYLNEQ